MELRQTLSNLFTVGPGSWLSVCSQPGLSWVAERTGVSDFTESAKELTAGWTRRLKLNQNPNRTEVHELDASTAWKYCTGRSPALWTSDCAADSRANSLL